MTTPVYLDCHATTPADPRVVEAMLPFFTERFGNPASRQHRFGWVADEAVESGRAAIARALGAETREIIFTSGATESNNLAIKGIAHARRPGGGVIVTVRTEHKSVLDSFKALEKEGFRTLLLPVDGEGLVDPEAVRGALTTDTLLVSVMTANNEIGTIQNIAAIGEICRSRGVVFHTDAAQALGKIPLDVRAMNVDLLSFTGHKLYGPKGVGGLYVRGGEPRLRLAQMIDGGGHERGLRSGTLNVPAIVGLARAVEIAAAEMPAEAARVAALRDRMEEAFTSRLGAVVNGSRSRRLPNNLNVSFPGVEDNALMMSMKDVAVSTGSACSTANPEPSHVLKALGVKPALLHSAIRFGLGRFTTAGEVDYAIRRVGETVSKLRELSRTSPLEPQPT